MTEQESCPNCKRELVGQHNFCPYCGHDIRTQKVAAPATAVPMPPSPQSPPAAKPTPPPAARSVAKRSSPKRFQLVNLRTLLGMFDLIAIPLIAIAVILWARSGELLPEPLPPLACEDLDTTEFSPPRFESGLTGELGEDTLFTANTEYLIQGVLTVPPNRRLLVEPGVRLEFEEGAGIDVQGAFYVCGSEQEPITFTAGAGEPGSWQGIRFLNADDSSVINQALVQFAGDRAIYLENSAPSLVDVEIANGSGFPISSDGNEMPLLAGVSFERSPFDGIEIRGGQTADKQNILWPNNGFVYVLSGPVIIGENTALEIEPGVNVKFWQPPRGDAPGLRIRGLLKAEDVRFTSVYDSEDSVGGVTYVEAQDPVPGDWAGISFLESSGKSYLRNVSIQYAGRNQGAINMQASSPELVDVTIRDSAWYPLSADANSFPTFENLTLTDNDPGDALEIVGNSAVTGRQERVWKRLGGETQIVRVIRGRIAVDQDTTLIIEPGVVVKFEQGGRLTVRGTLRAIGGESEAERIVFTSLRDGDYGGDTDKNSGPQDVRTWEGIVFEQTDSNSLLQNSVVRYAPVSLNGASSQLINVTINDSPTAALIATPNATPTLVGLRLQNNDVNGMAITGGRIESDQTWSPLGEENNQLIRILADTVTVVDGAVLQIDAGTIIKADSRGKLVVNGGLRLLGNEGQPVTFTSLHDDNTGGDTNQKLQGGAAGDWPGIEIGAQADVVVGHAVIRFATEGLFIRDSSALAVNGLVLITDGKTAVRCQSETSLPANALVADRNEVNEIQCPNP